MTDYGEWREDKLVNELTQKDREISTLKADCEVMAAWFKDLIEDDYVFGDTEIPAYQAAIKYIQPSEFTLIAEATPNQPKQKG
jgi:hypothetical protein